MATIKQYKKIFKPKVIHMALKFKSYNINNAIIIFSEARGGSTWLMELLKNIPGVIINWEPLHVTNGVVSKELKLGWRPYLPVNNKEKKYISLFSKIFRFQIYNNWTTRYVYFTDLKRSKYVLTKFVRANLCLPWVVNTFPNLKHRPILLLRHPIATCISRLKTFEKIASENISIIKNDTRFKMPDCINNERFQLHLDYVNCLNTKLEVEIAIWCINNVYVIHHKDAVKWYTLYYEDLMLYPEQTFQTVLQGIEIKLSEDIIKNIDYRKASSSNYHGDLKLNSTEQLELFLKKLNKEELLAIQAIFDYFGLKVYSAFNAYPIK